MTLAICIIAKDGVVIGSDSRASSYLTSNDTVKKIFKLNSYNAVGISGDGPLAMHLFDLVVPELEFKEGISSLAEQLRKKSKEKFDDFFSHQEPEKRPGLSIILSGYSQTGKSEIYLLNSEDNFVPRKSPTGFECIGIPIIAEYILNRFYEPEITTNYAAELATFCIKETSSQDNRVGGPVQIAIFSNEKPYVELLRSDIAKLELECEQIRLAQKSRFYPEEVESQTVTPKDEVKNNP